MAFTQADHQALMDRLGLNVTVGNGRGNAFLRSNPQYIDVYEAERKKFQPEYSAQALRETATPSLQTYTANQVQNPTLPSGTEFSPVQHVVQQNELLDPDQYMIDASGANVGTVSPVTAPTISTESIQNTPQVDAEAIASTINPATGQYTATTTAGQVTPEIQAAQGTVSKEATVKGQLEQLYAESNAGVPEWAQGAVRVANEAMAARRLGVSSIAAGAITEAVQQSALQIAATDAATYFSMDMANLNNRQQANLENVRNKQQNMLTDVAVQNAAAQFNASSALQTQQFVAQLITGIKTQNADRSVAVEEFNVAQKNQNAAINAGNQIQVDAMNMNMDYQVKTFNANLTNQREQFNKNMAATIDQSNVTWRRAVNTNNTAAINAALQANVQNSFNMSMTAQNQLWNQWRDEVAYLNASIEAEKDRQFKIANIANDRAYTESQQPNWVDSLGGFAMNLLEGI